MLKMNPNRKGLRIVIRLEESGKSLSWTPSFGGPGRILAGSIFLLSFISLFLLFQPDRLLPGERDAGGPALSSRLPARGLAIQMEHEMGRLQFLSRQLDERQRTIHGLLVAQDSSGDFRDSGRPDSRVDSDAASDPNPNPDVQGAPSIAYYGGKIRRGQTTLTANLDFAGIYESLFEYLPYRWPLLENRLRITSPYGYRSRPFFGGSDSEEFHPGLDLRAAIGDPVVATAPGTVSEVRRGFFGYGNMVRIEHPSGYETLYAHLSSIIVKKGDVVRAKQIIGLAGETGKATGPHLHYEMKHGSERIDPVRILAL